MARKGGREPRGGLRHWGIVVFVPTEPKIYHIVHVDRLASIVSNGYLWSDSEIRRRGVGGTTIGMNSIKESRLTYELTSHPGLRVGDCVPFYFCPRSVMLYVIHMANNPELAYREGQDSIVHLEADMRQSVNWADANNRRWAFTTSNAGSLYFENYADLSQLNKVDWDAVEARKWSGYTVEPTVKDGKQAEFLIEDSFSWDLVTRVGIKSRRLDDAVQAALNGSRNRPIVEIKRGWYY